jgi:hypothetical protein
VDDAMDDQAGTVERGRSRFARLELGLLALLSLIAVALRVADLTRPLDRQFDGFQGAFFALAAIDYERLEPERRTLLPSGAGHGYPVVNLELDAGRPDTWYVYANHPPLVPLLAWAALEAAAPAGWNAAWRAGRAPRDFEAALRAPFLALHLGAVLLLFLALRVAGAARVAAYAAPVCLWLPSSSLYAGLVNYEQPALFAILLGAMGAAGYAARGGARWLVAIGLGFALGGAVTYAPAVFALPVALVALTGGWRRALVAAVTALAASLATLGLHAGNAARTLARRGEDPGALSDRVETLLGPLLDGSLPLSRWLAIQGRLMVEQLGWLALGLAAAGLLLSVVRLLRAGPTRTGAALVCALLAGGAGVQFAFYRHTGDPQDPFLILLVPGLAAAAGTALAASARRAPLAALALTLALVGEGAWRAHGLAQRWRAAPPPVAEGAAPRRLARPIELGATLAALVPPGAVIWAPERLGLGPSTGFYAWRTLLPVSPGAYATTQVLQNGLGLGDAPTWLVAPDPAPLALRESIGAVLLDLEGVRPGSIANPDGRADGWSAWRLR